MPKAKDWPRFEKIPRAKLLEPSRPMRETFDDEKLIELADSIRRVGIVQSLAVIVEGDQYRIAAGHRRYVASGIAGLAELPCMVWPAGTPIGEAIKNAENGPREDVNPAEEATYLEGLLREECGGDVDQLCSLTGLKRDYVEKRLLLLGGDPKVLEELRAKRISFSVAQELNKFDDDKARLMHLQMAVGGGASARLVQQWRAEYERLQGYIQTGEAPPPADAPAPAPLVSSNFHCHVCESDEEPWTFVVLYVHRTCLNLVLNPVLARATGKDEPARQAPAGA